MRKNSLISYHTSSQGLRMVHLHRPGSAIGICGAVIGVGSRDESPASHGLAHFVEHTIFKGTARRSSWHIINRMEAVGGELNAYTTKEETVVYSVFPSGNLARAAELIADLTCNSRFPEAELAKERDVVADEIDSYLDSPSEAVFDDFEDLMFAGSGLGHNILGTRAALDSFTSEMCREYLSRWYVPSNMVIFYAGNMGPERVFRTLEHYFSALQGKVPEHRHVCPPQPESFSINRLIDSHQTHTVVGARIGGFDSPDHYRVALLTNILGGPGMNSLLNVALRERRGLVYSVDASTGIFTDCGLLAIYFGCDPSDTAQCLDLVKKTIADIAAGSISPRRLEMAKKQFLGQLIVGSENLENRILGIARQTLLRGYAIPAETVIDSIKSITSSDLNDIAKLDLSSLSLGPADD